MTIEQIAKAIHSIILKPDYPADPVDAYGTMLVRHNLANVSEYNVRGDALCGTASSVLVDCLPGYFKRNNIDGTVFTATSSVGNGCFHHFNIVKIAGEEPLICDLTASQYFTRPLDLFAGKPYFLGLRQDLKNIVETARINTWRHIQKNFSAHNFRTTWDFDYAYYSDRNFRDAFFDSLKRKDNAHIPCLLTESLHHGFEITWGETSRLLFKPETLSKTFDIEANVNGLITGTTPDIADLVTCLSVGSFKRTEGPQISPAIS